MIKKVKKNGFNKKGFTLIEIISVITIIGVLLTLASLSVTKYINKSVKTTYESYKKDLSGAANNMMIDCISSNKQNCIVPDYGNSVKITYKQLVDNGYSKNLRDPEGEGYCDKSYVVVTNESDNSVNLKYKVCLFCSKYTDLDDGCVEISSDDVTPPVCDYTKISGSSTTWTNENRLIGVGCTDTGSGCKLATFTRNFGKNDEVIEKGNIIIEDKVGNQTSCTVDVYVDKKDPTCELELSSDGTKVELKTNDIGSGVKEFGIGNTPSADYNNEDYLAIDNNTETVYGYVRDKAGNSGTCIKTIKVDKTKPTCSLTVTSGDGFNGYFKSATLSLTTVKGGSEIVAYGISESSNPTYNNLSSYTVYNGIVNVYGYVKDNNGNIGVCNHIVYIDNDGPTLNINNSSGGNWTKDNVILTLNAYDSGSGIKSYEYSYDGKNYTPYSHCNGQNTCSPNDFTVEQERKIYIRVCDYLDNCTQDETWIRIDKTLPTCNLEITIGTSRSGYYPVGTRVSLNKNDVGSGIDRYGVSINNTINYNSASYYDVVSNGDNDIYGYVKDKAGNESSCKLKVAIDSVGPVLTGSNPTNGNWVNKSFNLTLNASDSSGVKSYLYSYDNRNFTEYTKCSGKTLCNFPVMGEQNKTIYIKACDYFDNCGNTYSTNLKIDRTPPTVSSMPNINNIRFEQHDPDDNIVGGYLKSKSCNASTHECTGVVCLVKKDGWFNLYNFYPSVTDPNVDGKSGSGVSKIEYVSSMYNGSGNLIEEYQCRITKGHNPCTWNFVSRYTDNAGNVSLGSFKFTLDVGYIGVDSFCK